MGDYLVKAVEIGKEATAIGIRAGGMVLDKTKDIKTSMGGGAKFFEEADERDMEIKKLLDGSDRQKLEGMKKLIALISKGKDVAVFFPDVVKNVVCKHHEVKKLVYIFLVRYAEQEPDIALLSINTFQKDLTDSNQLIRALALRVLSNIRIDIIIPIVMLAIKKCVSDLSPYVRKTAALAIPKIYSLDPSQKSSLIDIIETLLNERSTLVMGSVIAAFNEVCPDRFDLIHRHFKKLCYMLIDVDEWGMIHLVNLLLRYGRTQFVNPNFNESEGDGDQPFYSDEEDDSTKKKKRDTPAFDPDLRLLLNSCAPLLSNRNSAVVLQVATLYFYLAPKAEFPKVGKPLVALLGTHPEVQYVVLSNISTLAALRPTAFEPYLKKFYVLSTDPFYIKVLKLEILTRIATEGNINQILREFQTYVKNSEKKFVTETIQAIGRCAVSLPNVADTCLHGLMALISSKNESVVGEAVVVIKSLLQLKPDDNAEMIRSLAKALDKITVPLAKASIIWLMGEYCEKVPTISPDILRKFAKTFASEEDIVKLEVLNLGAKLYIANAMKSEALFSHVLNVAKYDLNYDIRDRARFLKHLCFSKGGTLSQHTRRIMFALKPTPQFETVSAGRERFVAGSLSHILNKPAPGYQELPDFPEVAPDPSVRAVYEERWQHKSESLFIKSSGPGEKKTKKDRKFDNLESFLNSDDEGSDGSYNSDRSSSRSRSRSRSYSRSRSRSRSYSRSRSRSRSYSRSRSRSRSYSRSRSRSRSYSRSRSRSRSYSRSRSRSASPFYSDEEEDSKERKPLSKAAPAPAPAQRAQPQQSTQTQQPPAKQAAPQKQTQKAPEPQKSLLDFDDMMGGEEAPTPQNQYAALSNEFLSLSLTPTQASQVKSKEASEDDEPIPDVKLPPIKFKLASLLSHITGRGLSVEYFFGRRTSLFPDRMVSIQLVVTNRGQKPITNIRISTDSLEKWAEMISFNPISELGIEEATEVNVNVDFNQKANPINFHFCTDDGKFPVKLEPPFGELLTPKVISHSQFKSLRAKLGGMFESAASLNEGELKWETGNILKRVYRSANVSPLDNYGPASTVDEFNFHGLLLSTQKPVLVTVKAPASGSIRFIVNSEDMVVSSTILKNLKTSFTEPLN